MSKRIIWWQASATTNTTISKWVARYSCQQQLVWLTTTWDRSWTRARFWCMARRNYRTRRTITGNEGHTAPVRLITSGSTTWRTTRSIDDSATTKWSGYVGPMVAGVFVRLARITKNTTLAETRTKTTSRWEIKTRTPVLQEATWPRTDRAPLCLEGGEDEHCPAASQATLFRRIESHQTAQLSTIGASSRAAPAHRVNSSSPCPTHLYTRSRAHAYRTRVCSVNDCFFLRNLRIKPNYYGNTWIS